jgi:hypothetical protein
MHVSIKVFPIDMCVVPNYIFLLPLTERILLPSMLDVITSYIMKRTGVTFFAALCQLALLTIKIGL